MSYIDWWPIQDNTSGNNAASITCNTADDDALVLTLDEINFLVRCGKKDKKLAGLLRRLLDGVEVELPL